MPADDPHAVWTIKPVDRPVGANDVGVVAWRLALRTPECPAGREVRSEARVREWLVCRDPTRWRHNSKASPGVAHVQVPRGPPVLQRRCIDRALPACSFTSLRTSYIGLPFLTHSTIRHVFCCSVGATAQPLPYFALPLPDPVLSWLLESPAACHVLFWQVAIFRPREDAM